MLNMINKLFGRNQTETPAPIQAQQNPLQRTTKPLQPRNLQSNKNTQQLKARETNESLPIFDVNDFQLDNGGSQHIKTQSSVVSAKTSTAQLAETMEELNQLNRASAIFHQESVNNPYSVSDDILRLVNAKFASEHSILPVGKDDNANTITLYYSAESLKQKANLILIRQFQGKKLDWVPFDEETLKVLIHDYYFGKNSKLFQEETSKVAQEKFSQIRQDEAFSSKKQSVVIFDYASKIQGKEQNYVFDIIQNIICRADRLGATDINISNRSKINHSTGEIISILMIRARVDGRMVTLEEQENIDRALYNAFPQVLKILAGVDFVSQKSDSGKISGKIAYGKMVCLIEIRCLFRRCGSHGQAISMRMQKQYNFDYSIHNLGLTRFQLPIFKENVLHAKEGLNVFNGKVNRGKNVTQIASVKEIAKLYDDKEIISVERPIEFIVKEIQQDELEAGEQYSSKEEELLRSTPDIVIIGETRNDETAKMVMKLADTGVLVKTTLHAKNSCHVADRLEKFGIDRYDVAQALNFVSHQTLVRKICTECVRVVDTNPIINQISAYVKHVEKLGFKNKGFIKATGLLADGTECSKCLGSGYSGRTGVFELLVISQSIRDMIQAKASPFELRRQALAEGMHTQFATGLGKVIEGETTLEELLYMVKLPTPEEEGLDMDLVIDDPELDVEAFSN